MAQTTSAFAQQLDGDFLGMLQWQQPDLWLRVRAEPQGWYASLIGEAVPEGSSAPIPPRWVLSRTKPERIEDDAPLPVSRRSWWQRLLGAGER